MTIPLICLTKAVVIDWYYHKIVNGQRLLHYVKFVDEVVLYATENDPELAGVGFTITRIILLYSIRCFPSGRALQGRLHRHRQERRRGIDALNQNIDGHARMIAYPRWFVRGEGSVTRKNLRTGRNRLSMCLTCSLGRTALRALDVPNMDGNVINILNNLVVELKGGTTGNRDVR